MKKSEIIQLIREEVANMHTRELTDHQKKIVDWISDRWKNYSINMLKKELNKSYANKELMYLIPTIKKLIQHHKDTVKEDVYNPYSPKRVAKPKIVDYSNSKYKIMVVRKTSLMSDMKQRWQTLEKGDSIYYFDKGDHFATLMDVGTPYQMLYHDGTVDEHGYRSKK